MTSFHNLVDDKEKKLLRTAEETGADNDAEELTVMEVPTEEVKPSAKKTKKAKKEKKEKKAKGGKKGRGNTAPGTGPRSIRDKIRCSNCNNLMTQSINVNYEEIPGKKIPKGANGKPAFKSFGVAAGKVAGVLCDDCLRLLEAGNPITIDSAVIEDAEGNIRSISVNDIPDA